MNSTRTKKYSPYFKRPKKEKELPLLDDKGVPDFLDYDLKVLFVGINPGLTSGAKGHHYAGPTNHFWPSLSESGLVDQKLNFEDDVDLPKRYRLGLTNLSARTTRKMTDLSLAEQREGIPILNGKIQEYRPRCSELGLQADTSLKWSNGKGETVIFVMPSTSGLN
ncbi:hypothetical protein CU098_007991 [Rhizopus stolonifer]|uniref:Uracil-DNA glycosylase-like domain-containing protein n=1 Tax=Rhizopus stolonifer TaxID=4846 RepID=A0A367JAH0_RHIST|nr:hypothetical protein CU098_007991 [Rhizopus stolonifer]